MDELIARDLIVYETNMVPSRIDIDGNDIMITFPRREMDYFNTTAEEVEKRLGDLLPKDYRVFVEVED